MVHRLTLDVRAENFAYAKPFRIAGHVFLQSPVVEVRLSDGLHVGRGEGGGVFYLNDDVAAMTAAIEHARAAIEGGLSRAALQEALPPGGGRNALDCALWELESKASGVPVWKLAGLSPPRPLRTTFTLGADDPAVMARGAVETFPDARALKLKLTGDLDLDIVRVEAVRAARPDCWIGVDANQGYAIADLAALVRAMERWDIRLIEQPLARGREADLDGFASPIPIAADESILSLADIEAMPGRFDVVNIKLDKCGGLTEALAMARRARALGLGVMVGNMMGTSLATAPAYLVGQYCDVVDLDGPTFLAADRQPGIAYRDGDIECSDAVWGHLAA
ncbi:dipeptide epimerase [Sphingobium sp. AP49]|uniref:dipeptide epimerase n=1 Tax=Sphingobium sp. AP49 TaxID=1144307 RepID=UPI00026EDCFE|nr:dipeptide epimerase [Sphingobium sp. AP49]WHO38413.1 dipeptide epimerase [Sphingobium sp. AP49]